ncbi:hypothetical protein LG634_10380 [Streptomyces bambusae]|uniref:hypothetical protein n=1 Tax=Streptomyces bambusae TaxID=1550616 RepID=UPI001CFCDEEF|nr:hypothetical protein [Streptomyces bambusae]MCB5165233.1 hypothetical protein [Streptomyces bambusae]
MGREQQRGGGAGSTARDAEAYGYRTGVSFGYGFRDADPAVRPADGARPVRPAQSLWVEEPFGTRRMADPVREAAVRAVLLVAVTLIQASVTFLLTVTGSWLAFPMVLGSIAATMVATWGVLDVWVTRQTWHQRNGVVSVPSSTARRLRRERRRARRAARIRQRGGQLSEA